MPALTDRQAPPVEHLRARLGQAWTARHSSPHHREVLGRLLPDLIADAQLAAHQAEDRTTRRAAQAVLAEVYALTQFFVKDGLRSEEHTSELQSRPHLVCRLLLEKKKLVHSDVALAHRPHVVVGWY